MQTKFLECKLCGDEVEVPSNRASVVCKVCGQRELRKQDLTAIIEKDKRILAAPINQKVDSFTINVRRHLQVCEAELAKLSK